MKYYEILVLIIAIALVVGPIISYFIKRKKGTLKCECGHLRSECIGNCSTCSNLNDLKTKKYNKYLIHLNNIDNETKLDDLIKNNFKVKYVKSIKDKNIIVITALNELNTEAIKIILHNAKYEVSSIDKLA